MTYNVFVGMLNLAQLQLQLRQLSTHIVPSRSNVREARSLHIVKSFTLNPYMSLLNLKS